MAAGVEQYQGRELSDLAPRDRIDIQSFIWVVGDYQKDGEEA